MNFYIETIRRNYLVISSSICVYVCQLHTKHRLSTVHNSLYRLGKVLCKCSCERGWVCLSGGKPSASSEAHPPQRSEAPIFWRGRKAEPYSERSEPYSPLGRLLARGTVGGRCVSKKNLSEKWISEKMRKYAVLPLHLPAVAGRWVRWSSLGWRS